MLDTHVSLAHGNGGRYMRELIHQIFARHLANPLLDTNSDAAVHGTTNDLAVAGAIPKCLSLGVILEEGLDFAVLERVVAVVAADDADRALAALRSASGGGEAAIIGAVREQPARVVLETTIGGERVIEELEDDPLPRIC
jgi:hydrogenase expression/formation protein HypE